MAKACIELWKSNKKGRTLLVQPFSLCGKQQGDGYPLPNTSIKQLLSLKWKQYVE